MNALLAINMNELEHEPVPLAESLQSDEMGMVRRAQAADAKAFEALYRRHVDKV